MAKFQLDFVEQNPELFNKIFKRFVQHENSEYRLIEIDEEVPEESKYLKAPDCSTVSFNEELFNSMKFSDITFIVDGTLIEAHRSILASKWSN